MSKSKQKHTEQTCVVVENLLRNVVQLKVSSSFSGHIEMLW